MSYNPTVARFKMDMLNIVNRAKQDFHQTLLLQAEELAENIKSVAPIVTGTLRSSVRTRDVSNQSGTKLSVLVIAGGSKTTKRSNGNYYDYSVGTEFGTVKEQAEPFFYNTYRLYRANGIRDLDETFKNIIDESNRQRDSRPELSSGVTTLQSRISRNQSSARIK